MTPTGLRWRKVEITTDDGTKDKVTGYYLPDIPGLTITPHGGKPHGHPGHHCWTITHVDSGGALPEIAADLKEAAATLRRLGTLGIDWTKPRYIIEEYFRPKWEAYLAERKREQHEGYLEYCRQRGIQPEAQTQ